MCGNLGLTRYFVLAILYVVFLMSDETRGQAIIHPIDPFDYEWVNTLRRFCRRNRECYWNYLYNYCDCDSQLNDL